MKKAGQKFLQTFLNEIRESNLTFLNEKGRRFSRTKIQTFLNENRFIIKFKLFEWKKQARNSYIFANFPQRNSIWNQIENF